MQESDDNSDGDADALDVEDEGLDDLGIDYVSMTSNGEEVDEAVIGRICIEDISFSLRSSIIVDWSWMGWSWILEAD